MGANAALVLQLAITALQHATELNQLLQTALAEGRDVSAAELDVFRQKAQNAVDTLAAAQRPATVPQA